jgi:hypothetical protein
MVFNLPRRGFFASLIAPVLILSGMAHGDEGPLRTYFVGNGVTDMIRYGSVVKLAKSRGHTLTLGAGHDPKCLVVMAVGTPKGGFLGGAVWALSQGNVRSHLGRAQLAAF